MASSSKAPIAAWEKATSMGEKSSSAYLMSIETHEYKIPRAEVPRLADRGRRYALRPVESATWIRSSHVRRSTMLGVEASFRVGSLAVWLYAPSGLPGDVRVVGRSSKRVCTARCGTC